MTESRYRIFVKNNVPFSELKKVGFFPKEMKFNDYSGIVKRFLSIFGEDMTMDQYEANKPELYPDNSFISAKFPDKVNEIGEFKPGEGVHLSLVARDYDIICCICECPQTVNISTSTGRATKKCKGCKRKISILVTKEGVTVSEI